MRKAEIVRNTNETQIEIALNLDGSGKYDIDTGAGFLTHMLELFARHGRFDLKMRATGDTDVDMHHTAEDVGIALGMAFSQALGNMRGIVRYGSFVMPMDESLVLAALDLSGRTHLNYDLHVKTEKVGQFDAELIKEFFLGFCRAAQITLHLKQLDGENTHHIFEAAFKGFGRAMKQAVAVDENYADEIPSTKGIIKNDCCC